MTRLLIGRVTVVAGLLAFAAIAHAQNSTDCLLMAREGYRKIRSLTDGASACRARYTIRTIPAAGSRSRPTTATFSLTATRDRLHIIGDAMEMYQDPSAAVMITSANKTIYIRDADPRQTKERRVTDIAGVQDSVLAQARVIECSAFTDRSSGATRRMVLALSANAVKRLGIERITLLMNEGNGSICNITLHHSEGNPLAKVEVSFHSVEYGVQTRDLDAPVISLLFNAQGMLLPKYNGYKVIDTRTPRR